MPLETLPLARTVLRGGVEIHHAEAGSGRPLVFVHGAFGDWRSWAPQWEAFVPGYRCISYSRRYSVPNRNESASPDHSALVEAEDLHELLVAWNAMPAILVGTSYGAYTALALALKAPRLVRALVIAEPPLMQWADRTPGGRTLREAFERAVMAPAKQAFQCGETERAVRLLSEGINGNTPNSATTPAGLARRLENANAMRVLSMSREQFPVLDEALIRALDTPTLLIAGAHTEPIHDAIYRALCGVMSQAEQVRIPNCGHGAHRDNATSFNNTVLDFLRVRRL